MRGRVVRRDRRSQTITISTAVADNTLTVVNAAGSINCGAKASRHNSELAAKHDSTTHVSTVVRIIDSKLPTHPTSRR
jgi:hypothetical protein